MPFEKLLSTLSEKKKTIDAALNELLPPADTYPQRIHEAIRYSVLSGGKRIRPILATLVIEATGREPNDFLNTICSIELLHNCSLILDDLPSMDNANMRHGVAASHRVYGEATAILAATALLNFAFQMIVSDDSINKDLRASVLKEVTHAVGTQGAISGQIIDLDSKGEEVDFETLEYIHSHKTGSLFICAARTAAIVTRLKEKELDAVTQYAKNLGLAYQISDDILDVTSDSRTMGKDTQKDADSTTFISFCGLEEAERLVNELTDYAIASLDVFGKKAMVLEELARHLATRKV